LQGENININYINTILINSSCSEIIMEINCESSRTIRMF